MSNPLDDMGAWWRDNFHRQSDYMVFHGIPTLERMAERDRLRAEREQAERAARWIMDQEHRDHVHVSPNVVTEALERPKAAVQALRAVNKDRYLYTLAVGLGAVDGVELADDEDEDY